MLGWELALAVAIGALITYVMVRTLVGFIPLIHMNEDGEAAAIMKQMSRKHFHFKPTIWLPGGHAQTLWGSKFRSKPRIEPRRETINFEDGGTAYVDWFEPANIQSDTPVVIILPTLAGGSQEPCTKNLACAIVKHGWRAVVANYRGCSGAPLTSARLYNAIQIDDITVIVDHVQEKFKPKFTFMVGFSFGATLAIKYAVDRKNVDGYVLVSHLYSSKESARIMERTPAKWLYMPSLLKSVTDYVRENSYLSDELKNAANAKTLTEFDDLFTAKTLGMKDVQEYYTHTNIHDKVPNVNGPMLIIGSEDDPMTSPRYQPRKEVEDSGRCVFLKYPTGGHAGFITGISGTRSVVDELTSDWFDAVIERRTNCYY